MRQVVVCDDVRASFRRDDCVIQSSRDSRRARQTTSQLPVPPSSSSNCNDSTQCRLPDVHSGLNILRYSFSSRSVAPGLTHIGSRLVAQIWAAADQQADCWGTPVQTSTQQHVELRASRRREKVSARSRFCSVVLSALRLVSLHTA